MSDAVTIPDLRKLDPRRKDEARAGALRRLTQALPGLLAALRGAAPGAAAAALCAGAAFGGGRAYQSWRDSRLELGGVRSTIHPESRAGGLRLALAAQASRGELRWDDDAAASTGTAAAGQATDWASALRLARPEPGPRAQARAFSRAALAQLRIGRALSGLASGAAKAEDASAAAHGAFSQQLTADARPETLLDSLNEAPKALSDLPAPDMSVRARNATPYQGMLEEAYADAKQAAVLKRRAPASLAAGAALLAAGRAMLGVPGAGLAARGLLAAGAAATSRGLRQTRQARQYLARAQGLVSDIHLLQGQKDQAGLAEACVEALASGAQLERCKADAPAMDAFVRASVDRELGESAVWEVEGGRRLTALAD
jgi:hypothetical protein